MIVVKPVKITESILTSSIAEPDVNSGEIEWTRRGGVYLTDHEVFRFAYSEDRREFYITEELGLDVYIYSDNFVYTGVSFSVASETADLLGITVANDHIYIINSNYNVYEYSLDGVYTGLVTQFANSNGRTPLCLGSDGFQLIASFAPGVGGNTIKFMSFDGVSQYPFDLDLGVDVTVVGMTPSARGMYFLDSNPSTGFSSIIDAAITDTTDPGATTSIVSTHPFPENGLVAFGDVFYSGGAGTRALQITSNGLPAYGSPSTSIAISSSNHKKYISTTLNQDPPEKGVLKDVPTWVEIGATNKYAMFDELVTTQSVSQLTQVVSVTPGSIIGGLACLNISGVTSINVTMTDPIDGVVYDRDINLADGNAVIGWFSYFYEPIIQKTYFVVLDLPPYLNATTTVTATGSGEVGIGALVLGKKSTIGATDYDGTTIQDLNFDTWTEDEFGNVAITKRPGAKLVNYGVKFDESQLNYVAKQLEDLRGEVALYVGSDGDVFDYTISYGIKRESEIDVQPKICTVPVTVRGIV